MNFIDYSDEEQLSIGLADRLAGALKNALLNHERVSFAVPGGTTPGPVFDTLCAASLDWDRVDVLPTDERWVPEGDPRSNAGLVRGRLLTGRAAAARYLTFHGAGESPEVAAAALAEQVAPLLPISVLLLGMGPDMHCASLFPGTEGLEAALAPDAPAVVAMHPPTQPEPRLSLSAAALDSALSKHLLITGMAKRDALERAMTLPPEEAPVGAVLSDMNVHWTE